MEHRPVLKESVQNLLDLSKGDKVVDATLGLGGHSLDILKAIGKEGKLFAFEQDEENLKEAKKRLKDYDNQVVCFYDNFRYLKKRLGETGINAFLFDLGLSSPHVDVAERGFSFMKEGPLDMRFDKRNKLTAYDVVNSYNKEDLADIFFQYGEERMAKKIARKITEQRKIESFETTKQLADFIEKIIPKFKKGAKSHAATKVFQALRIEVNDELNALKDALGQAVDLLKTEGRIVIISYHSLEDRIVKKFFKSLIKPLAQGQQAIYQTHGDPFFEAITKKPIVPDEQEIETNPRSRSAKLRAYKKIKLIPKNYVATHPK